MNVDRWNQLICTLTQDDQKYISSHAEDENVRKLLNLDDFVSRTLHGIPDEWTIHELDRLIKLIKKLSLK